MSEIKVAQSVYHLLQETSTSNSSSVAVRFCVDGKWQSLTFGEFNRQVHQVADALIQRGVTPGERVAILSKTRVEWSLTDFGILAAGACTVPIYHSSIAKDVAYILNDANVKTVFVEDEEQLEKVQSIKDQVSSLEHCIRLDTWQDFFKTEPNLKRIRERTDHIKENDLASIVYTSGTTGEPKGVMLTHDNLLYEALAIEKLGLLSKKDVQLLFLPLAHVFAKVMQIAWVKTGHVLVFAESMEKVVDNMKETKPTMMAAVPRVYEKVYAKVVGNATSASGIKGFIARWALGQQKQAAKQEKKGRRPTGFKWFLAQRLVMSKIETKLKETFGGHLRFFISGGAPLSPDITYFFKHAGITILEGYGLTETTAASCVNVPSSNHIGTVGKPVPGTELQFAEDGEVLIHGRGVFKGYWNRPEATKEVLTSDGWFHTGDIGVLTPAGFLRITDRKKDLIVNAGGKKIAPQKIENLIKSRSALISQVVVHGDERPYLTALLVLDEAMVKDFAKKKNLKKSYAELTKDSLVHRRVDVIMKSVNQGLPSYERIKKWAILDHDFVIGDQLTPTLKVKRHLCEKKYRSILDQLYG